MHKSRDVYTIWLDNEMISVWKFKIPYIIIILTLFNVKSLMEIDSHSWWSSNTTLTIKVDYVTE